MFCVYIPILSLNITFNFYQVSSVPEILRPLYESSYILAQKMTMAVRTFCFRLLGISVCYYYSC